MHGTDGSCRTSWFVDMGHEITGSLLTRAAGKSGDQVVIHEIWQWISM
ncbi:hypothetical protein ACG0Z4_17180 [Enterocloster aldenensis]